MSPVDPRSATRSVLLGPENRLTEDAVIVEEPLEIRVEGRPLAITLRTPGHDRELAAGFLYTEGVIDGRDDLVALAHAIDPRDPRENTIDCRLAGGVEAHRASLERATRELYATSSCGICGKASLDRLYALVGPLATTRPVRSEVIQRLPEALREAQGAFLTTGGCHAAGLFSFDGELEALFEDIGRHNAVDKALGWRLLADRAPVDDRVLVVSSRAGFEIVQKALVARVPAVVSIGAASTLAIDLAVRTGMKLYGFVRENRWIDYTP